MNARLAMSCSGALLAATLVPAMSFAQSGFVRADATATQGAGSVQAPMVGATVSVETPGATADVPWEERTAPYHGGAVPPGAQIDERINGTMVGGGAAAIVVGYLCSLAALGHRPVGVVPLVGPVLALGGIGDPTDPAYELTGGNVAFLVVSEILQVGGAALFTAGLFLPRRTLVYDAPVNAPPPGTFGALPRSHRVRWAITPGAPGAVAGLSLTVAHF